MTSFRQFEANRRNALKSTGPRTEEGERRSRGNAVRHGLTAETVIASLEEAEDHKAFEAAVISELVLRLASLLWRLRRAMAIETQLLEAQAEVLKADTSSTTGCKRKQHLFLPSIIFPGRLSEGQATSTLAAVRRAQRGDYR
jgi:hypothetical protein